MSGLDAGIVLLAVLGAFLGMKIGAVSAFFNVLGGFAGGWAAARFYLTVMATTGLPPARAYLLVFLTVAAVFVGAGIVLSRALESFFLGLVDKLAGALLGMALSLVFAAALFLPFLLEQDPSVGRLFRRSAFAPHLMRATQKYFRVSPRSAWEKLEASIQSAPLLRVRRLLESSGRGKP